MGITACFTRGGNSTGVIFSPWDSILESSESASGNSSPAFILEGCWIKHRNAVCAAQSQTHQILKCRASLADVEIVRTRKLLGVDPSFAMRSRSQRPCGNSNQLRTNFSDCPERSEEAARTTMARPWKNFRKGLQTASKHHVLFRLKVF